MNAEPTFPSKRDTWIVFIIWVSAGIEIAVGTFLPFTDAPLPLKVLIPLVCGAGAALAFWVLYGTDYRLTGDTLVIRCGPFRFKIPLAEIDAVTPSRDPLSSPACSLDRLLIQYRHASRRLLVSPHDKTGFLEALVERCPHLSLSGQQVVRTARG